MSRHVLICGSRNFSRKDLVDAEVDRLEESAIVITGGAVGPDRWAEWRAKSRKMMTMVYRPNYALYGRSAPLRRNDLMLNMLRLGDAVFAFWDGKSRGTKMVIERAAFMKQITLAIIYENGEAQYSGWVGEIDGDSG
jgi:hypothetical protein